MTVGDRVELAVLTLASALLAILCCGFLTISIGAIPFPITAFIACAVNFLLLWLAAQYTSSPWRFAPLGVFGLVVVIAMLPGMGGSAAWISGLPLLLMLLFGIGLPASLAARVR